MACGTLEGANTCSGKLTVSLTMYSDARMACPVGCRACSGCRAAGGKVIVSTAALACDSKGPSGKVENGVTCLFMLGAGVDLLAALADDKDRLEAIAGAMWLTSLCMRVGLL